VLGGPAGLAQELAASPTLRGRFDVIVLFCDSQAQLARRLPGVLRARNERGTLWLAWPKQSSGIATDLGEHHVRHSGLATGLVDNKICAIDETWSGLRFVRRRGG
jgi:hypothetical protein